MKKRKLLAVVLVLAMALSLLPTTALADEIEKLGGEAVTPSDESTYVAQIGTNYYETLAAAVAAVASSESKSGIITLLKDTSGSGIKLVASDAVNLTIDFGGYTYTCDNNAVGSTGYESQGFHLEKGNTVKLKNGKIVAGAAAVQMLIQNYCNLTLESLSLDGGQYASYLISSNYGSVELNGVNATGTKNNVVAIDLMHWLNDSYRDTAPTMTINNTSDNTITGNIDVYCYGSGADECESKPVLTITGGAFSSNPTDYVANGYAVVQSGNQYIVKDASVQITFQNGDATVTTVNGTYNKVYGTLPTVSKEGFTFDGWFTAAQGGTEVTKDTTISNIDDHTLYAHWTANTYTVKFDSNGGTTCADVSATYDVDVKLPEPTKAGFNFNGWNTAADGSGTSYQKTAKNLTAVNGAAVTLYAQWTNKTAVSYDNTEAQAVTYDGSVKAYALPEHALTGFAVAYKQGEASVSEPTNAGSYDVVITRDEDDTYAAFSKTITDGLVIEKAKGSIEIKPSAKTLSGGGKVTLTVTPSGLPADAVITVTCDNNIAVADDLTAYLPNSSVTYTFTAAYTDKTDNYEDASATCTVEVSRESYGGGSSSGGSSTTTEKNPDGSTTTTVTDKTTGTVTETTKDKDGTTTTVETKKDGTVTETVKTPEGVTGTVVTDKYGDVSEAKATVSTAAAKEAAKTGEAVTLPVEVPAVKTTEDAPAVQVTVPKSTGSVKVEVPVEKVTPGTVAVIVNADGTEKIVSTSVVTENGVALTLEGNATVKIIDNSKTFTDVPETNVFYNEISSLSAREIMVGKTNDKFDLYSSVTLNQIANVAGRIIGAVDVKDYNAGIAWGAENGLKTGNVAATRGDVLKALYVAAGSPAVKDTSILAKFADAANIPADMAAIAAWAAQKGILKGDLNGNANLTSNVTRGQACALAGRTMGTLA